MAATPITETSILGWLETNAQNVRDTIIGANVGKKFLLDKAELTNVIGIDYTAKREEVVAIAIDQPALYRRERARVVKNMLSEELVGIYEKITVFLTKGEYTGGQINLPIGEPTPAAPKGAMAPYVPSYPAQKANKVALDFVKTLQELLMDEVIEEVLPVKLTDIALSDKVARQSRNIAHDNPAEE